MATSEHNGRATARAGANFALVKYWGKADARLNVPAVGSISITLDALYTETEVELMPAQCSDELVLDGERRDDDLVKISACVDLLRRKAGVDTRVRVSAIPACRYCSWPAQQLGGWSGNGEEEGQEEGADEQE